MNGRHERCCALPIFAVKWNRLNTNNFIFVIFIGANVWNSSPLILRTITRIIVFTCVCCRNECMLIRFTRSHRSSNKRICNFNLNKPNRPFERSLLRLQWASGVWHLRTLLDLCCWLSRGRFLVSADKQRCRHRLERPRAGSVMRKNARKYAKCLFRTRRTRTVTTGRRDGEKKKKKRNGTISTFTSIFAHYSQRVHRRGAQPGTFDRDLYVFCVFWLFWNNNENATNDLVNQSGANKWPKIMASNACSRAPSRIQLRLISNRKFQMNEYNANAIFKCMQNLQREKIYIVQKLRWQVTSSVRCVGTCSRAHTHAHATRMACGMRNQFDAVINTQSYQGHRNSPSSPSQPHSVPQERKNNSPNQRTCPCSAVTIYTI